MNRSVRFACVSLVVAACGGGQVEPAHVEPVATAAPRHDGPKMRLEGQLGSIDEGATKKTFDRLSTKFQACQMSGLGRIEYLSGDVKFFLLIGEDGKAKWGYLEKSTLGDVETERCLMDAAMSASWPAPEGGEAEIRYDGLGFDPPPSQRMPTEWPSEKIANVLGKHGDSIGRCVDASKGAKFMVTAYVEPSGKVQAVGIPAGTAPSTIKI